MKKLLAIAGLTLFLTSCADAPAASTDKCVMKDRVATLTETYEGTEVGFCCNDCKADFEALSTEDRATKIADAAARK